MQGITENDLMDLTPALKAEALEVVKRYRMGPLFTPPVVSSLEGPLATLQVPADVGGANWPGGSMDPENNFLYIHSHTAVFLNGLVPANPAQSDMGYVSGQARAGGAGPGAAAGGRAAGAGPRTRRRDRSGPAAGETTIRPDHGVQHEHRRYRLAEGPQLDA